MRKRKNVSVRKLFGSSCFIWSKETLFFKESLSFTDFFDSAEARRDAAAQDAAMQRGCDLQPSALRRPSGGAASGAGIWRHVAIHGKHFLMLTTSVMFLLFLLLIFSYSFIVFYINLYDIFHSFFMFFFHVFWLLWFCLRPSPAWAKPVQKQLKRHVVKRKRALSFDAFRVKVVWWNDCGLDLTLLKLRDGSACTANKIDIWRSEDLKIWVLSMRPWHARWVASQSGSSLRSGSS